MRNSRNAPQSARLVRLGWLSSISAIALLTAPAAHALTPVIFGSHAHAPQSVDQNGIDLGTGQFVPPSSSSSIGDGSSGLSESSAGPDFHFAGGITVNPDEAESANVPELWANSTHKNYTDVSILVFFGGYRKLFTPPGSAYQSLAGKAGCYLAQDGSMDALCPSSPGYPNPFYGTSTLTTSDGTVAFFQGTAASDFSTDAKYAALVSVGKPDGEAIAVDYYRQETPTNADPVDDPNININQPRGTPPANAVDSQLLSVRSSLGWYQNGVSAYGAPGNRFSNLADPLGRYVASVGAVARYPTGGVGTQTTGFDANNHLVANQTVVKERYTTGATGVYNLDQTVERRDIYYRTDDWTGATQVAWANRHQFDSNVSDEDIYDDWSSGADIHLISTRYYTDKYTVTYTSGRQSIIDYYTENQHPGQFLDAPLISGGCNPGGTPLSHPLNCVHTVTRGTSVWTYSWGTDTVGSTIYPSVNITDPLGHVRHLRTKHDNQCGTFILSDTDETGKTTTYEQGGICQVGKVTYPDGNSVSYLYNGRGDLTEIDTYNKDHSAHTTQTAGYPTTCTLGSDGLFTTPDPAYSTATDYKVCHQPLWTKDAKGNQTDYTYSTVHGGVLTVTAPAADSSTPRAQTRNVYVQVTPKTIVSGAVHNETPIWRLHCTVTLPSTASSDPSTCAADAQYQVTTYAYADIAYDPSQPSLLTNNALVTSVTVSAGDGTLAATTSYGYDAYGNRVMVDGPRTDVDDRSYTTYDDKRRPIFEFGVDPDGSGSLRRVAVQHHYDDDFREDVTYSGTCGTITFTAGVPTGCSDFQVNTYTKKVFDHDTGLLAKSYVAQP